MDIFSTKLNYSSHLQLIKTVKVLKAKNLFDNHKRLLKNRKKTKPKKKGERGAKLR